MAGQREAAYRYAARGWPVLPVKPRAKLPLTEHGVKDASTDVDQIAAWWERWPNANVGIACGAPGPTVLDIDDLAALPANELAQLDALGTFTVATNRGRHYYATGTVAPTVKLASGHELRGAGGYVVAPPSQHESGTYYTVLDTGAAGLASVDAFGPRASAGYFELEPTELVPLGNRHTFLQKSAEDAVLRGITDRAELEALLRARFEARCDPDPPPRPDEFSRLADWATGSKMAADVRATGPKRGAGKRRTLAQDAPRSELRAEILAALGVSADVPLDDVLREGPNLDDGLVVVLGTGHRIRFDRQGDITQPRLWQATVIAATAGIAKPPPKKQHELAEVLWALVTLAEAPEADRREEERLELVTALLALAELPALRGDLARPDARYELLGAITERRLHDPREGVMAKDPTLVVDMHTGKRYLRGQELANFARHAHGLKFGNQQLAGLMASIGLIRHYFQAHGPSGKRGHVLYELPEGL